MKRVLVIGAGIGGLSAAIRLQNAGYQVEIYEKNAVPGGKMHRLEFDGHSFDVGPTLVMMPSVYREIFEIAGRNPDDYIPMVKLDPMYDVYFNSSPLRSYSISNDLEELHKIFEAIIFVDKIIPVLYFSLTKLSPKMLFFHVKSGNNFVLITA